MLGVAEDNLSEPPALQFKKTQQNPTPNLPPEAF